MGKFGQDQKQSTNVRKTGDPGPGSYVTVNRSMEVYKDAKPKFSFGSENRGDNFANHANPLGPGSYPAYSDFDKSAQA